VQRVPLQVVVQQQQWEQGQGQVYLQGMVIVLVGQAVPEVVWPVCGPSHLTGLCWTLQRLLLLWGLKRCPPC
jgi:hypothetical protein